jgi:hypothetical protein
MSRYSSRIASLVAVALFLGSQVAFAGPPLLCHPFDIGTARSLPWDGKNAWWKGHPDYDVSNLVADTEALLTASTPVIVRMETLRRAALYASHDADVAKSLLAAMHTRARAAVGAAPANPLAFFDAGYLAETFRQITLLEGEPEFRAGARALRGALNDEDGYALVKKSLAMRPDDRALEFAAALIARSTRQSSYQQHADKAREGATYDALLARNIKQLS